LRHKPIHPSSYFEKTIAKILIEPAPPLAEDVTATKFLFATDIHICWSKFLNAEKFYEAGLLILGSSERFSKKFAGAWQATSSLPVRCSRQGFIGR